MGIELKQHLKLAQQLRMTPQLQQAIKLLQLSRIELSDLVQKELVENPVLEDAPESQDREAPPENISPGNSEREQAEKAQNDIDWDAYVENFSSPLPATSYRQGQDDMPGPEATLTKTAGLDDHLKWQLHINSASKDELLVGEEIIGNLNDSGFLVGISLEEIAENCGVDLEYTEEVLSYMQGFDPIGVCARDLQESLLIQARHYYPENKPLHLLIEHHLESIQKRKIKAISRSLNCSEDNIVQLTRMISTLDPRPGSAYTSESPIYITPDVYVSKVGDEYICSLNEDGLPKLRISEYYQKALKEKQTGDGEAKAYIQDKLRSAWWLIRSIHQRQRTILRVTESIVRFQKDFLDHGVGSLKPLVLRHVAEDIGVHESTVSRVTSNKFVHTPQGLFDLKYFFNSAIGKSDGSDTASESIKVRIKQIIGSEDSKKPYSDQKIVEILAEEGIEIARRTVAKYREMQGILKSSQRKRLF